MLEARGTDERDALTLSRDEIRAIQEERIEEALEVAWNEVGYYRDLWRERGGDDSAPPRSFGEWPLWNVTDLRRAMAEHPPFGNLYTDAGLANIRFIHSSSGTTGKPRYAAFTAHDEPYVFDAYGRIGALMTLRSTDTIAITGSYGLPIGAWSWTRMAQTVGATIVPAGSGRITPSDKLIDLVRDLSITAVEGTPSYLLHVGRKAEATGRLLKDSSVHLLMLSGEGSTADMRRELKELWGVDLVTQMYANSDVSWIAAECEVSAQNDGLGGMHVLEDVARIEILNSDGSECANREYGELVLTSWLRRSTPRIRFRTGDLAAIDTTPCACGRSSARLLPLRGRTDDAIRFHSITIWPRAVEEVIGELTGRTREFYLELSRDSSDRDVLTAVIEAEDEERTGLVPAELAEGLRKRLTVAFDVRIVGHGETLPITGLGTLPKTRRFIDLTQEPTQ